MAHLTTFVLAIDPRQENQAVYQKTFGINGLVHRRPWH